MIRGEKIYLRPLKRTDIVYLQRHFENPEVMSEFNFFGFHSSEGIEQEFNKNGFISDTYNRLAVVTHNEQIVGMVDYRPVRHGPSQGNIVYFFGIELAEEHRGLGYGTEAHKLLVRYLFATYPIVRIETLTDSENKAEQRALEKSNFTREGVMRQAQWRNGAWHDMVLYSILRQEQPA
jgi:RimJ/RimL family protein N-acetyltransferase